MILGYAVNYIRAFDALIISFFTLWVGRTINLNKRILYSVLTFSDKYSFDIYICHMVFVVGALKVLNLTESYCVNILLALFLTGLSAIVFHKIVEVLKKMRSVGA